LNHEDAVHALAFDPQGRTLASGGGVLLHGGVIKLWDVDAGRLHDALWGMNRWISILCWSDDGRVLTWINKLGIGHWVPAQGKDRQEVEKFHGIHLGHAVSGDGRTLAYSDLDAVVHVLDSATGQERQRLATTLEKPFSLALSWDGRRLAVAGFGALRVWDLATGRVLLSNDALSRDNCTAVALSPDGGKVAFVSGRNDIHLWDVPTGSPFMVCKGHENVVTCLAFAPDGKRLASGGKDNAVRLWDPDRGQAVAHLMGHTDAVMALAFAPDSRLLASGGEDHTVRLWRLDGWR
jgi:WD40 repeat protein